MTSFAVANLTSGVLIFLIGAALLLSRRRLLRFVRYRFEKVYREDGLSEVEIERRLPRMAAVVSIAGGFVAFGVSQVLLGIVYSR